MPKTIETTTEQKKTPKAVHEGTIENNVAYLKIASILDRKINLVNVILNPPRTVPCFSSSCFGPHALERKAA